MVVSVWQVHFLLKRDAVGSRCVPLQPWGFNVYTDGSCVAFVGARESVPRCAMRLRVAASVVVLVCTVQCYLERQRRPEPRPKGNHYPQEINPRLVCCSMPAGRIKNTFCRPNKYVELLNKSVSKVIKD